MQIGFPSQPRYFEPPAIRAIFAAGPEASTDRRVLAREGERLLNSGDVQSAAALLPGCGASASEPLLKTYADAAAKIVARASGQAATYHTEEALCVFANFNLDSLPQCMSVAVNTATGRYRLGSEEVAKALPAALAFAHEAAAQYHDARAVGEVETLQRLMARPQNANAAVEGLKFIVNQDKQQGDSTFRFAVTVLQAMTDPAERRDFGRAFVDSKRSEARAAGDQPMLDALEMLTRAVDAHPQRGPELLLNGLFCLDKAHDDQGARQLARDLIGKLGHEEDAVAIARQLADALEARAIERNHAGRMEQARALRGMTDILIGDESSRRPLLASTFGDATIPSTPDRAWAAVAAHAVDDPDLALDQSDCAWMAHRALDATPRSPDPARALHVDAIRAMVDCSTQSQVAQRAVSAVAAEGTSYPGDIAAAALQMMDATPLQTEREAIRSCALKYAARLAEEVGDDTFTQPLIEARDLTQMSRLRGDDFRHALASTHRLPAGVVEHTDTTVRIGGVLVPRRAV